MVPVLRKGVRLGTEDNPVVTVPGVGTLVVDPATMTFLRAVAAGDHPVLASDAATCESMARLAGAGILEPIQGEEVSTEPPPCYRPAITDLVIRRNHGALGTAVRLISHVVAPATTVVGVGVGLILLFVGAAYATFLMPVRHTLGGLANEPLAALAALVGWHALRAVAHEGGHFAVARRAGERPPVGFGLYLWGPVLFVDLSCLDTAARGIRLRADLAGASVDGWLVAALTGISLTSPNGLVGVLLISSCAVGLANLRPTEKFDGYWALRDALNARAMAATWGTPRGMLEAARGSDRAGRRFARLLLLAYLVGVLWMVAAAPRWFAGILDAFSADGIRAGLMVVFSSAFGLLGLVTCAYLVWRRIRVR